MTKKVSLSKIITNLTSFYLAFCFFRKIKMQEELNQFVNELSKEYSENRKLVAENLANEELLTNTNVQKCFIINSIMSSKENLEAGFVCWLADAKDTKKFINSYKIHFEKTPTGYTYFVDYVDDTTKQNN
jgi:hypothetical protein